MANTLGQIALLLLMAGIVFLIVAGFVSLIVVLVHAFRHSVIDGLLSLFLPFYIVFYMFSRFSHRRRGEIVGYALAGMATLGALGTLAVHGMRRFIFHEKRAEARFTLGRIAKSVCHHMESESARSHAESRSVSCCTESTPEAEASPIELPPTAPPVPSSQSLVRGGKYKSVSSDWGGTWHTIGFSMADPQRFQYEWERVSAMRGVARATADLDGDGTIDARFELAVECKPSTNGLDCQAARHILEVGEAIR